MCSMLFKKKQDPFHNGKFELVLPCAKISAIFPQYTVKTTHFSVDLWLNYAFTMSKAELISIMFAFLYKRMFPHSHF